MADDDPFDCRTLRVERAPGYLVAALHRPEVLNALNLELMGELIDLLRHAEADDAVRCIVLAGGERAFAAGADIGEMASHSYATAFRADIFAGLSRAMEDFPKPVIAAVGGYALGGGCELAMLCDLVIAADDARFGQPELGLGIAPGMGGSQRLTRAVRRSKAADMILTGRMMSAAEALDAGLVARVVERGRLMDEARAAAEAVAALPPEVAVFGKAQVNAAF